MRDRADLNNDLPADWKPKRIIFYTAGLKVYGVLPYILNKKLKGEFFSNHFVHDSGAFKGMGILAPTAEDNYTVIPYQQKPECARLLVDWLYADAGFEWAIAVPENWDDDIRSANVFNSRPYTWVPGKNHQRNGFSEVVKGLPVDEIRGILGNIQ